MKKVVLFMAIASAVAFSSCSKDDDEKTCAVCSLDFLGTEITTEACDNGDGTVTITVNGETQTVSEDELDGVTAAQYVQSLEDGCP